ncbi:MAG TPA: PepSY-associated TM helix domain-containing protein, partial [Burkholderiales bacterium]|nr:PepSY-associated TM helix domain-containing protein [Burkholderiales bacterium]
MRGNPSNPARRRSFWLKQLHQWHWISSAICLIGMLLFALTGITLNHAAGIEAQPRVTSLEASLPPALLDEVRALAPADGAAAPAALRQWLAEQLRIDVGDAAAEWSADEIYFSLPRPGGDAWLSIDRATGEAQYERTDRGWISYLNDLHKGRNTGTAWRWFLDIFAVATLVFCL